jgi:hypothetical protein
MFKKKAILEYESAIEIYPEIITPARNHIPDWYKKIPKWKNNEMFEIGKGFNPTIKNCMPFLDCLQTGYMIVLPNDLYVKNNNGKPFISWRNADFPPIDREQPADISLIPTGHYDTEYVWQSGVANTVPIGYSVLFTHPLNRHDLPFTTLSGIVDGGLIMNPRGQIPFYIKKGFEGIIPQGTPIIQLIPFRQEHWLHKKTKNLVNEAHKHNKKTSAVIYGWYKKTFWVRKKYN